MAFYPNSKIDTKKDFTNAQVIQNDHSSPSIENGGTQAPERLHQRPTSIGPKVANHKNDRPNIGWGSSMGSGDARGANFGNIVAVSDVDERHALRAKNDPKIGAGKAMRMETQESS